MNTIDLHIHSWYSDDGTFLPAQLVQMCASQGISEMAIADHNIVRGVGEAMQEAAHQGITCIPAIEIDCTLEETNLHMLGYQIDWHHPAFAEIEENIHRQTADASQQMLQKINELGLPVTAAEMCELAKTRYRPTHWTGEMFAQVLLGKPELQAHPLLRPYRPGGERSANPYVSFYWDYCSQGKPCHVPTVFPTAEETIRHIHLSGGKAFLAHPGISLGEKYDLLNMLTTLGLDGVEAFSSYHTQEQAAFYAARAKELGLRISCGSDFHGETKPAVHLGGYTVA